MSIATKLQKILDSKAAIKTAIAGKGGTITDATPLDEYAQAVNSIPSGDDSALKGIIDRSITSCDIPNGITSIGRYAFYECKQLTSVNIPQGVLSIGYGAFVNCIALLSPILPNSLEILDVLCFRGCRFSQITIPNNVKSIGNEAFNYCDNLQHIAIPDSTTTIGNNVCQHCRNLTDVAIGSGIVAIGSNFASDTAVNTVRIYADAPPTLGQGFLKTTFAGKIYVPDASVNAYKTATNWSTWASYIYPLSDYQP